MTFETYRNALVTGATSGIGDAVVRALCERDVNVLAVGRRGDRLAQLASQTGCEVRSVDLTEMDAVRALGEAKEWDIVVNNAGVLHGFEGLSDARPEDIDRTLDTNVRAIYHLLATALPGITARQRGHIVNLGSMAGLYALPSAIYGGSKAAVHMLCRSLRMELHGTGVKVTEIAPGRVETEIYRVGIRDEDKKRQLLETGIDELRPEDVAAAVMYAIDTPPHVNVNLLEIQPTEQTYGGSQFVPTVSR